MHRWLPTIRRRRNWYTDSWWPLLWRTFHGCPNWGVHDTWRRG